ALHAGIFPLHGEGTSVTDGVQRAGDPVEVDLAAAGRAEVPAAPGVAEVEVRAEDTRPAVEGRGRVLDVDVIDAVGAITDELDGIDHLPLEVARVEVEPELRATVQGVEGALGRIDVEGDLGRVDLQGEADAALLEHVEDWVPAIGQVLEAGVDHRVGHGR